MSWSVSSLRHGPRVVRAAGLVTAAALFLTSPSAFAAAPSGRVTASAGASTGLHDTTTAVEALRVDRVRVPPLTWFPCTAGAVQCATVTLPLDYDQPDGATAQVAVARRPAAKPDQRIGTLFVNAGGPGGSTIGTLVIPAKTWLDQSILDRFDIVGVDPRGTGYSDTVRCFPTLQDALAQRPAGLTQSPLTVWQQQVNLRWARALAAGCGTAGQPLAGAMSTAEVARDMDVIRRALGEKQLNYLGFLYGSQLGLVYANMFPDRIRAVALDGASDPVAWTTGHSTTGRTLPREDRLRTAEGTSKALRELMRRCDRAGDQVCAFAESGNSLAKFNRLAERLTKKPVPLFDPFTRITLQFGYRHLVLQTVSELELPGVGVGYTEFLQELYIGSNPASPAAARTAARTRAASRLARLRAAHTSAQIAWRSRPHLEFPYANTADADTVVTCSDSVSPTSPATWVTTGKAAARRVPHFGLFWNWAAPACAQALWTARDEDRYLGPFTRRTALPVLLVGNYYNPDVSYEYGPKAVSRLLPNNRLLSSNTWGSSNYGVNPCVTTAVNTYLLTTATPAAGTVCRGPQPFR